MLHLYVYLSTFFQGFQDEEGQGMAEYGLILTLVAVAAIVALTALGGKLGPIFQGIADKLVPPA